jgi:hypothetical protein
MMRFVAFVLFVIAAGKIGLQEHFYRAATRDAVIAAYRERAISACQRDPNGSRFVAAPQLWTSPGDVKLVVGKSGIDVWIWQIDHALWSARWRDPYLHLTAPGTANAVICEYDVVRGHAVVQRS